MCFIQAIVYMLVNKVMEQMTATVVEELFNDQAVVEMLAEDPGITKKREETQQAIVYRRSGRKRSRRLCIWMKRSRRSTTCRLRAIWREARSEFHVGKRVF